MSDFLSSLSNPAWWLSVVFAGIAINIASSYLKSGLDRYASTTAGRRRRQSELKQEQWRNYVSSISASPQAALNARHREIRALLKATFFVIFAVFFSLVVVLTPDEKSIPSLFIRTLAMFCGSFELLIAFLFFKDARREASALRESGNES